MMSTSWTWGKFSVLLITTMLIVFIAHIIISGVPSYPPSYIIREVITISFMYTFYLLIGLVIGWIACRGWKTDKTKRLKVWTIAVGIAFAISLFILEGIAYNNKNNNRNDKNGFNLESKLQYIS